MPLRALRLSRKTLAGTILTLFGIGLMGACGAVKLVTPQDQGSLNEAKASFAVVVSDAVGTLDVSGPVPQFSAERRRQLEQPLLALLRNVDKAAREIVAVEFVDLVRGTLTPRYVAPQLRLSSDDSGVSYDPQVREVVFGTDVLRANLVASVETVLGNPEFRKEFSDAFVDDKETSRLKEFDAIAGFLRTVDVMPSIAEWALAKDRKIQHYSRINDSIAISKAVADAYYGSLAFVIGHELGHSALDHEFTVECATQRSNELAADQFSALVLSHTFMLRSVQNIDGVANSILASGAFDSFRPALLLRTKYPNLTEVVYINDKVLEYLNGFATFLDTAYRIGPFAKDRGCYPSAEARLNDVRETQKLVVNRRGQTVLQIWVDRRSRKMLWSSLTDALLGG